MLLRKLIQIRCSLHSRSQILPDQGTLNFSIYLFYLQKFHKINWMDYIENCQIMVDRNSFDYSGLLGTEISRNKSGFVMN
jgi:hypothetical protein